MSGGINAERQSGENRRPPSREFAGELLCLSKAILAWPAGTHHGHRTDLRGTQFSVDEQEWWSIVNLVKIQRIVVIEHGDQLDASGSQLANQRPCALDVVLGDPGGKLLGGLVLLIVQGLGGSFEERKGSARLNNQVGCLVPLALAGSRQSQDGRLFSREVGHVTPFELVFES